MTAAERLRELSRMLGRGQTTIDPEDVAALRAGAAALERCAVLERALGETYEAIRAGKTILAVETIAAALTPKPSEGG